MIRSHFIALFCLRNLVFLFRSVVFGFTIGPWAIQSLWFLVTQEGLGMGSILWSIPKVKSVICWLLSQALCLHCPQHNLQSAHHCRSKLFCLYLCFCFSFGSVQIIFPDQMRQNTDVKVACGHQPYFSMFNELCGFCLQQSDMMAAACVGDSRQANNTIRYNCNPMLLLKLYLLTEVAIWDCLAPFIR